MSASSKNQVGCSATLLPRRDQRSLRDTPPPCLPAVASLRSRSSRTEGHNARFALRFRLKLGCATFRSGLHSTKLSVPSLRYTPARQHSDRSGVTLVSTLAHAP